MKLVDIIGKVNEKDAVVGKTNEKVAAITTAYIVECCNAVLLQYCASTTYVANG